MPMLPSRHGGEGEYGSYISHNRIGKEEQMRTDRRGRDGQDGVEDNVTVND